MASDQQPAGRKGLEEMLAALGESQDSEGAFLQLIFEGAERRDPELPELLRAGAIPRTLNAAVIGVLREAPDDDDRNNLLLEMVSGYRFVLKRPDGGFIYHDNTRDYLLADWRSTDAKRARFVELNESLAAFYKASYAESQESNRSLAEVSELMSRANPGRLRRLIAVVEANMGASLLEALYHQLLASPRAGFDYFQTTFFELESANRFGICRSLISFTRDFLRRLPPAESEPTLLSWLEYFDARVQRSLPGYDVTRATDILRRLLARADTTPDLRSWALNDLAQIYENQLQLDEALRTRLEWTEQSSDVDTYNVPLRYNNLGNLYWTLKDYLPAVRQFQLAIDKADELPDARKDTGVTSRLNLSGVYGDLGDWAAAFETATEALYRARTSFPRDRVTQYSAAARLADLFCTFDPRASDCASAEVIALGEAAPEDRLAAFISRVDLLLNANRPRMARSWIGRLDAELGGGDSDSLLRFDLAYQRARLAEDEGHEAEAAGAYSALLADIADQTGSEVLRINALTSRGSIRARLGDAAGAVADLTIARDDCLRFGYRIDAAEIAVRLATTHLKAGDITAAQTLLDGAEADLPTVTSQYRVALLTAKGEVDEGIGKWPAAGDRYLEAFDIAVALRNLKRQASLQRKLAALHAKTSEQSLSAEYDRRAGELARQLVAADAGEATDRQRKAESENAKGMRSFCAGGDRAMALDRARQLFCSAVDLDPDNLWPLLNLSFTYAEQQDWQGASETLARVLDLSPAPMRTVRLHSCLRDYVLEYTRRLLSRTDAAKAAAVGAAALDRLAGKLPSAELASLRAVYCMALAVAGETTAARDPCREVFALPEGERAFADTVTPLIDAAPAYWAVDTVLREVQDEPGAPTALRDTVEAARARLNARLDEILGLTPGPSAEEVPVVTPIIVEVGDGLVPIVDSSEDGGVFLYELIPAMRERILTGTGVNVPGVRMRGDPALPEDGYRIQVDEVTALTGSVPLGVSLTVLPAEDQAGAPAAEITDFHPLTGERGLWVLADVPGDRPDGAGVLTPAQRLIHQLELVLRANLARYLGPAEVSTLVDTWSEGDDENLIPAVLPDADSRLLLTWILQRLVDDAIPVTDWRTLLTVVREAGGITAPSRTLYHAAHARLRDRLPGPQTGRKTIHVPAEYEAALLGRAPDDPAGPRSDPRLEFLRWLRDTVAVTGPAITLVAESQDAVEVVSGLARTENRMITTLSRDELAAP